MGKRKHIASVTSFVGLFKKIGVLPEETDFIRRADEYARAASQYFAGQRDRARKKGVSNEKPTVKEKNAVAERLQRRQGRADA